MEKRQESVYEHLPYARLARRRIGRVIPDAVYDYDQRRVRLLDAKPSSYHQLSEPPKCRKCGADLPSRKTLICPCFDSLRD